MARLKSYTVHLPPAAPGKDPDAKVEVVGDVFSPIAFVAPWAYFLIHRMWLEALGAVALIAAGVGAGYLLGLPSTAGQFIGIAAGLFIGLEAVSLKRWSLARRGYVEAGVIVAASQDEAERRFFAERDQGAYVPARPASVPTAGAPTAGVARAGGSGAGPIIGMFPSPDGAPRGFR